MRQRWVKRTLLGVLVIVGTSWLGASPAKAQFPIFYGGEVLTPFGNRNSDGSYRTMPPRRTPATQPRYYASPPTQSRYDYPTQPQYYYAPQPRYYYAPRPQYYYAPNGYSYRR